MKKFTLQDHNNFLKDLEELSEEEKSNNNDEDDIFFSGQKEVTGNTANNIISSEKQIGAQIPSFSKLMNNTNFLKFLQEIENNKQNQNIVPFQFTKESRIYHLISDCNRYITEINQEINLLFKSLKEFYSERFPELASIILNPYEYALTVKSLGNDLDVSRADFSFLPSNVQLSLNVVSSTTSGKGLSKEKLNSVRGLCDEILALNFHKKQIISFIETQMSNLCPNLSALIGSNIAAKLVTAAGGVVELSKMPSSNVLVMGAQRINLEGFSTSGKLHMGYLAELDEVQKTPDKHKAKILRRYAGKATLMARVDAFRTPVSNKDQNEMIDDNKMMTEPADWFSNNNNVKVEPTEGIRFKEEIGLKMSKIIEPQQPVLKKPLPRPDEKPRRTRGGRFKRSIKARFAQTEMRMMKNRMKFGPDSEHEFQATGKGFGLLGVGGTGSKMKAKAKVQKISTRKQKLISLESQQSTNKGLQSGLHSSVAFTPVEGIELINPELLEKKYSNVKDKYFSSTSGFSTVINQKKKDKTLYEL